MRLAVVVLLAELISRHLPLSRSYWMVVAAATTLRPEFGATFTRGAERAGGTALGVGLAGAIAVALHPAGAATVALVGVLAWAAYAVFPANFAVGFAFITAVVVFLLNAIAPDTLATAWARLLDTLVGGTLGLLAYALWPTWSYVSARQSLADLVQAERAYVKAILAVIAAGRRAEEQRDAHAQPPRPADADHHRGERRAVAVRAGDAPDRRRAESGIAGGGAPAGPRGSCAAA